MLRITGKFAKYTAIGTVGLAGLATLGSFSFGFYSGRQGASEGLKSGDVTTVQAGVQDALNICTENKYPQHLKVRWPDNVVLAYPTKFAFRIAACGAYMGTKDMVSLPTPPAPAPASARP
jgi:hypothetical protein